MNGYIKLFRSLLDWEWYDDTPVLRVFLHLLLTANWKPTEWRGQTVETGQVITSLKHLATQCHLTMQQTRTALSKLESTGEITKTATKNYTIITVENYGRYQGGLDDSNTEGNIPSNSQLTNEQHTKQQTSNKRATTDKERKKERSNKLTPTLAGTGTFQNVYVSTEDLTVLKDLYPRNAMKYVDKLSAYKEAHGKEYESDYAQLLMMLRQDIGDLEEEGLYEKR